MSEESRFADASIADASSTIPGAAPLPLLPVVLQFYDIASNSNINFTFTTAGACWSLGARSGDSLGFSYNVSPESAESESCIQKIEFNNSVLSIRTGDIGQSLNTFTLTMFLQVADGVDFLQGYCTLNNEAHVMATIGAQRAVQWRNGRISAVLRGAKKRYRNVVITVRGALPGNKIDVVVGTKRGLGVVMWSLGPQFSEANGIRLASTGGAVPLASMFYGASTISFITATPAEAGDSQASTAALEFYMSTYIVWDPVDLGYIYLKTTCNSDISVYAQVGSRQPQIVSQTDTVFTL